LGSIEERDVAGVKMKSFGAIFFGGVKVTFSPLSALVFNAIPAHKRPSDYRRAGIALITAFYFLVTHAGILSFSRKRSSAILRKIYAMHFPIPTDDECIRMEKTR